MAARDVAALRYVIRADPQRQTTARLCVKDRLATQPVTVFRTVRLAPDRPQHGGSQLTDISRINRRQYRSRLASVSGFPAPRNSAGLGLHRSGELRPT